ncbi:hypothetical protein N752_24405 [Desulforamulus aquiferis]|nr:site-specific integrase [Desulforamulus aquiferis]RYD02474.1 hypothetical protein N752_24405 [Desulforamulus aquiferis]
MTDFEFQLEGFMLYCTSKNLSPKTLASYEQALKLFGIYLQREYSISEVNKIQANHIRLYIKNLRERGKYTVSISEKKEEINYPNRRRIIKKILL